MKKLAAVLFFIPFASLAQDCGLKKTTDPFTHVPKLSTGFKKFDNNGFTILVSADATPTEIDFFFWVKNDGKCFDDESTAQVVYEGERSRANFKNTGSMNCEGAFHFTFKNLASTPGYLSKLSTKKVATIKLTGSNKTEILITLTDEQKTLLQGMAVCMATEGKTLIKK